MLKGLEVLEKNVCVICVWSLFYLMKVLISRNLSTIPLEKLYFVFSDQFHFIFIYFETFICIIIVYYNSLDQFIKHKTSVIKKILPEKFWFL